LFRLGLRCLSPPPPEVVECLAEELMPERHILLSLSSKADQTVLDAGER
jgi:hypothetical protein